LKVKNLMNKPFAQTVDGYGKVIVDAQGYIQNERGKGKLRLKYEKKKAKKKAPQPNLTIDDIRASLESKDNYLICKTPPSKPVEAKI